MAASIVLPFLVLLLASSSVSVDIDFTYNSFKSATNLSLDGSARITSNGVLQLTDNASKVTGHAFFSSPLQMLLHTRSMTLTTISFSTTFVFDIITIGSGGGHGLAFAVAPTKAPKGSCCHYLGLLNRSNNGNSSNHVFAVEFDTVQGFDLFKDIDDNHIAVHIKCLVFNC